MYQFALLDPRPIPAAEEQNSKVLGPNTLGIEITVPALAARCGLGNIDPQHSGGDPNRAAIEEALEAKLLPEGGAILATVRADPDAIGAMALMEAMAYSRYDSEVNHGGYVNWRITESDVLERIRLIATADKFARGGWPGVRPLPTVEKPSDDSVANAESDSWLAPIAAAIGDHKVPIATRVEWMSRWLFRGEEPAGYRERWLAERKALAEAIASGAIRTKTISEAEDMIACVVGNHRTATSVWAIA